MQENELRIGNYVIFGGEYVATMSGDNFFKFGQRVSNNISALEYFDIKPIPLTEDWLVRMKDNENKTPFPDWIVFVHEAQNWYFWNNKKTELIIN